MKRCIECNMKKKVLCSAKKSSVIWAESYSRILSEQFTQTERLFGHYCTVQTSKLSGSFHPIVSSNATVMNTNAPPSINWLLVVSVMRVGSDTFGDPIFQKGLQN